MTGQPQQPAAEPQLHQRYVFELWLDCGHIATVARDGCYPVSVACCNRLGGSILRGVYVPYDSHVEYVNVRSERYPHRPVGAPRQPTRLLGRRPRTDEPFESAYEWESSAGRYPARVGATWNVDNDRDQRGDRTGDQPGTPGRPT